MEIKKSESHHDEVLTEVAVASKKFWNYPEEWMQLWKSDLEVTKEFIDTNQVFHLTDEGGSIVGFYAFLTEEDHVVLDSMFVRPDNIGKGFGKLLMNDFLERVNGVGVEYIRFESDPNSEMFYKNFGFETVEILTSTSIENREIPVMIKRL